MVLGGQIGWWIHEHHHGVGNPFAEQQGPIGQQMTSGQSLTNHCFLPSVSTSACGTGTRSSVVQQDDVVHNAYTSICILYPLVIHK
jgi:hypothetical protein